MLQHIGCCESKWARYTHEFIYHRFMFFPPDVSSSPFSVRAVFFFILLLPLHFCSRANRKQISSTHRVVIRSMNVCSGVAFAAAAAVVVVVFSFCSFHFLSHSMCVCASMIHILCNKTACPATYCTYGYQFNLTSGALSHFTQNNSGKKMISFMNNLGEWTRLYAVEAVWDVVYVYDDRIYERTESRQHICTHLCRI